MSATRVVLSIDPGQSGALASLADGKFDSVCDMPVLPRRTKGFAVDGRALAAAVRDILRRHPAAYHLAVLELVSAMPSIPGVDGQRRGMGATSAMHFGEAIGTARGVLETLGLPIVVVTPQKWKGAYGLTGSEKDFARGACIARLPAAAPYLQRKKDHGRADALLMALWAELTGQVPMQRRDPELALENAA